MSRLTPLDKALVLILVPIWVVCFTLAMRTQFRGAKAAVVGLSVEDADRYPALTGEFSRIIHPSDPLAKAGLRAGDRLVRLGNADLLGVGTLGFVARSLEEEGRDLSVPLVFERHGERRETSLALVPMSIFRPWLANSFAWAASALFLLLRGRSTPAVRAYFYFGMCLAICFCAIPGSRPEFYPWFGIWVAALTASYPLALHFFLRFPDDRIPEGRWHRIWPWFFAVFGLFVLLLFTSRMAIGEVGVSGTGALGYVAILAVATHKYRRADRVARRQVKWVLLGAYCAWLPAMVATALAALEPRFGGLLLASFWAIGLFPIFFLVSVARFNLFDIDRLLSGAISYTVLVILLAIGAEVLLEPLAGRAAAVLGIAPATGQVAFVALLAAVLIPAQRIWRPYVDRVFFAEGRTREREVEALLGQLVQTDPRGAVVELTGAGIERAFRPEFCAIYERVGEKFEPSYAAGAAEFPIIPATSEFIRALEIRVSPILLDARGASEAPAALRAPPVPGAAVIVPLRPGGALLAFIAIGPKQSGDVYPSTDLSLLATLGHTVSTLLGRLSPTSIA